MASPYATAEPAGGSPYASAIPASAAPPKPSGGGGFLGSVEHGIGDVQHGAQDAAGKVASTALSLGTGMLKLGKDAVDPGSFSLKPLVSVKGWEQLANPKAYEADPLGKDLVSMGKSTATSVEHPLRDPAQTAITALMLGSGALGGVAKLGYLGKVADAAKVGSTGDLVTASGDAAKAATAAGDTVTPLSTGAKIKLGAKTLSPLQKVPTAARIIKQPVVDLVKPTTEAGDVAEGPAKLVVSSKPVELHASGGHLARAGQALHDTIIQKSLDNGLTTAKQTRTAKYAESRLAGANAETARVTRNVRATEVSRAAGAMNDLDNLVPRRVGELASFLRSANVTGGEAAKYWKDQAAAGVSGGRFKAGYGIGQTRTGVLGKLAQQIHDEGMLKVGPDGNVAVDAVKYPRLAAADAKIAAAQQTREGILGDKGLMNQQGLQTRLDLVGKKMLGDNARPGQAFVSLKTSEKQAPGSPISRAPGTVIPLTKRLSLGKTATGSGVAKGLIPAKTSLAVARGLHDALRFVNSDELRGSTADLGSDVKRTGDDVLARDPKAEKAAPISQHLQEMLGRSISTVDETNRDSMITAARNVLESHIPGLKDDFAADRAVGLLTRAPEGFKWVPKQLIPNDLTSSVEARGKVEKFADSVNSAVTSATVYFKLGHLPTRLLTNLSTNAVQGSLSPGELRKSVTLAHDLTDAQKQDLEAATGTHGYQALPHAGTGKIAAVASKGANMWARKIDAPFRLNAILYELRQVGFATVPRIQQAIEHLKDPAKSPLGPADGAKVMRAVKGANRASIMYDGLSAAEKRYVARYMWFYPWTKGAVRFAGHTIAEHPVKAAAITQTGVMGAKLNQQQLGNRPSYEQDLTALTGGSSPLTSNFSSFTPYGSFGQVAQMAQHPLSGSQGVFGQLNPYYAAIAQLVADGITGKPGAVKDALTQAVSPTPELQGVNAFRHPPGANRMFGVTDVGLGGSTAEKALFSALARALGGAGVPRPTRKAALSKAAQGYHTLTLPNG